MRQSVVLLVAILIGVGFMLILVPSRMRQSANTGGNQFGILAEPTPTEFVFPINPPLSTLPPSAYLGNPLMAEDIIYNHGVEAIYSAQEAISLTLTQLPSGFIPTQIEARLITETTLNEQFLGLPPEDYETGLGPIWLVGVIGNGLNNADILTPPSSVPGYVYTPNAPQSIIGAYFAWDANSSTNVARGFLASSGATSMATILSFVDAPLTIATATDLRSFGEETSTPPTP